jgi:hypothetical protein
MTNPQNTCLEDGDAPDEAVEVLHVRLGCVLVELVGDEGVDRLEEDADALREEREGIREPERRLGTLTRRVGEHDGHDAGKQRVGRHGTADVRHTEVCELGDGAAGDAQLHVAQDDAGEERGDHGPEPVERLGLLIELAYGANYEQQETLHKGKLHASSLCQALLP